MDLRGLATTDMNTHYISGGMLNNQDVTDKLYQLSWTWPSGRNETINQKEHLLLLNEQSFAIQSSSDQFHIAIRNILGQMIYSGNYKQKKNIQIPVSNQYIIIEIQSMDGSTSKKVFLK